MDIIFILSNLHRFIRQRRKPAPPPAGLVVLVGRKVRTVEPADRAFLTWTVVAAGFLIGAIGVLWSML